MMKKINLLLLFTLFMSVSYEAFSQCHLFNQTEETVLSGQINLNMFGKFIFREVDELGDRYITNACPNSDVGRIEFMLYSPGSTTNTSANVCFDYDATQYSLDEVSLNNILSNIASDQTDPNGMRTVCGIVNIANENDCQSLFFKVKPETFTLNLCSSCIIPFNVFSSFTDQGVTFNYNVDFNLYNYKNAYFREYKMITDLDDDGVIEQSEGALSSNSYGRYLQYPPNSTIEITSSDDIGDAYMFFDSNSKLVVKSGASLTVGRDPIFNTTSFMKGCEELWQGIEVENGATLKVSTTILEDAENSIEAQNGSSLDLESNTFINNVVGIYSYVSGGFINVVNFNNNTFDNDRPLLYNSNGNPASPRAGVQLINHIGTNLSADDAANQNIFDNIPKGVTVTNSIATVGFNNFLSLDNGIYAGPLKGVTSNISIISNVLATDNTFNGPTMGIRAFKHGVTAKTNTMTNVDQGIRAESMDAYSFSALDNNDINAKDIGIAVFNNIAGEIRDNTITLDDNNNDAIGILLDMDRGMNVVDNVITSDNMEAGIMIRATEGSDVMENTITATIAQSGIQGITIEGGTANKVNCNSVDGPGLAGATDSRGVFVSMSDMNFLDCNVIDDVEEAIFFVGSNQASNVRGNILEDHNNGIQLGFDGGGANTVIGRQGFNGEHYGNLWSGTSFNRGIQGNITTDLAPFSQFAIPFGANLNNNQIPSSWNPADIVNQESQISFFQCQGASMCDDGPGAGIQMGDVPNDKFTPWIGDGILSDPTISINEKWIWRYNLATLITTYVNPTQTDVWMDDFIDDIVGSDTEAITDAESIVEEGSTQQDQITAVQILIENELINLNQLQTNGGTQSNIDVSIALLTQLNNQVNTLVAIQQADEVGAINRARQILNGVSTTSDASIELKNALLIWTDYMLDDSLTLAQETDLLSIANLCPTEYGKSVYMSRSILSELGNTVTYDDESLCNYTKPRSVDQSISSESINWTISPNPVNSTLHISIDNAYRYDIYNVSGQRVRFGNLEIDYLSVENLEKGFYIINVESNDGNTYTSKFIKQ